MAPVYSGASLWEGIIKIHGNSVIGQNKRTRGQKLSRIQRQGVKKLLRLYMARYPFVSKNRVLELVSSRTGLSVRTLYKYADKLEKEMWLWIKDQDVYRALSVLVDGVMETEKVLWKEISHGTARDRIRAIELLIKNRLMLFETMRKTGTFGVLNRDDVVERRIIRKRLTAKEEWMNLRAYVEARLSQLGINLNVMGKER